MIHLALFDLLKADVGISAVCSEVHETVRPLNAGPPVIVFILDDDRRLRLLDGTEGVYREALVSIDCYAATMLLAIQIADAVESALTDYSGVMGATSPQTVVSHVRLERRGPHLFEPDTELRRVPLEFLIGYEVG